MLPASAGDCFFSSKSIDGIFQLGSEKATRAVGSLAGSVVLAAEGLAADLRSKPEDSVGSILLTPELTLISS